MSDDDDGDYAEVIELKPVGSHDRFPPADRKRTHRECPHDKVEYDLTERTVECTRCKKPVDPIMVLDGICRRWQHIHADYLLTLREVERLNKQVEERKKTRATVTRAREARADVIQVDEETVKRWETLDHSAFGKAFMQRLANRPWLSGDGFTGASTMIIIEVVKTPKEKKK